MATVDSGAVARRRSRLAVFAGIIGLLAVLAAIVGALGSRSDLWHFRFGFLLLRIALYGGAAALLLGIISAIRARPGGPRRGFGWASMATVAGLALVLVIGGWAKRARDVPPIHDITTDVNDPPQFEAVLPLRADAPNPAEYGGAEIAEQQRSAYPDIQPLTLSLAPDSAFDRAVATARDLQWEIVASDRNAGRIEATATTFWFGFKDDVVIRIRPRDRGSVVDVRSVSRVGRSDVGTNARRIREFLERLRET